MSFDVHILRLEVASPVSQVDQHLALAFDFIEKNPEISWGDCQDCSLSISRNEFLILFSSFSRLIVNEDSAQSLGEGGEVDEEGGEGNYGQKIAELISNNLVGIGDFLASSGQIKKISFCYSYYQHRLSDVKPYAKNHVWEIVEAEGSKLLHKSAYKKNPRNSIKVLEKFDAIDAKSVRIYDKLFKVIGGKIEPIDSDHSGRARPLRRAMPAK
jgi:hypothetical protein